MIFKQTALPGVIVVEPEPHVDERGLFARTYCADEFRANGLDPRVAQCSTSYNTRAGTLRGLHYQRQPHGEVKLVRCTLGAIYDVVVDLRPASPTYCQWVGVELSAENRRALYVPEVCAHGFLTLVDGSEVYYQISDPYVAGAGAGVRWDDPAFGVQWPFAPVVMAERDASYPDYRRLPNPGPRLVKRVLLTGARGFIGSHCLSKLAARGFEVHAVSTQRATHSEVHCEAVTYHQTDLLDAGQVAGLVSAVKPSHLLHLAWVVTPGAFWTSPLNWRWVDASLALLRAFAEGGGKRVVMVGSCAEYAPAAGPCIEGVTPLGSATLYGASKAALSIMLPAFARQHGIDSTAWARIFYLYGPGEAANRLVPSVTRALRRGQPIPCTHGEQIRDFLYVEDVADALVRLLESQVTGAVNIASGQPTTVRTLLSTIGREIGREDLLQFGARPADPDEPRMLVADVTRLGREVSWTPRVGLDDGVRRTINWWREGDVSPRRSGGAT